MIHGCPPVAAIRELTAWLLEQVAVDLREAGCDRDTAECMFKAALIRETMWLVAHAGPVSIVHLYPLTKMADVYTGRPGYRLTGWT
jgi:hypothetical protein